MCFRQGVFQFERFPGRRLRLGHSILGTLATVQGENGIGISQSGICQCVLRVFADRVLEILDRGSQVGCGAFIRKICAFEIRLMSLSILRWPCRNRALLGAAKFRLQRIGDCFRDLAFHAKHVRQAAIIFFCPKM